MKEFRVINNECFSKLDVRVLGEFDTIEEAKQCEADNHIFHSQVEQFINGEWRIVLIDGMTDEERESFHAAIDNATKALGMYENKLN